MEEQLATSHGLTPLRDLSWRQQIVISMDHIQGNGHNWRARTSSEDNIGHLENDNETQKPPVSKYRGINSLLEKNPTPEPGIKPATSVSMMSLMSQTAETQ